VVIADTSEGRYDATLVCHDYDGLPHGLLPLQIQYASAPGAENNILQFWVIPVSRVSRIADATGKGWNVDYACSCCGLFGATDGCCQPISGKTIYGANKCVVFSS
jgi:hypothetical protein